MLAELLYRTYNMCCFYGLDKWWKPNHSTNLIFQGNKKWHKHTHNSYLEAKKSHIIFSYLLLEFLSMSFDFRRKDSSTGLRWFLKNWNSYIVRLWLHAQCLVSFLVFLTKHKCWGVEMIFWICCEVYISQDNTSVTFSWFKSA